MSGKEVLAKTVYAEARGEPPEGWRWVAWVIKNRAHLNRSYWGGGSIKRVCLHPGQFECWDNCDVDDLRIGEPSLYAQIKSMTDRIYDEPMHNDPTGGCDHYNNPDAEPYREWRNNVTTVRRIGSHVFYRSK